ncbi:MAG TPA: pantetheine-phosphate adenylyltransferase [Fimbriimonadales bacterium]|nr:pantetheine-phosphate adenylyltransferase [Fimbriimonadales bacterium]
MSTAVYPGSFDPPTSGHVDIVARASRIFDTLIVAIGLNSAKSTLFSPEERLEMLRDVSAPYPNVIVETFTGLLVEFAQKKQADALVRGLRAVSDFENEFQMALTNRKLAPDLETVFLMTSAENMFVSSSIVKEVAALGGDVRGLVPAQVELELRKAFKR